ncbi:hypothetical protein EV359DRAFT_46393 [Lentinula novae-zelandiae]|nr:hypothetical protein EV359DRAFT_46393 [Lentinula novae-zelandiae]
MSSWRKSASSRLSSFKGYIAQQDLRNTLPEAISRQIGAGKERAGNFKEWAGQKINKGYNNNGQTNTGTEKISLFPGWAARRYPSTGQQEESFEIEVFISGFATSRRSADVISRSQRAFLKLAKGKGELLTSCCFAALPKLEIDENESATTGVLLEPRALSHSTEDLLKSVKLPPRPEDIAEDYEVQLLERKFQSLNSTSEDADSLHSPVYSQSSSRASSVNDLTLHDNTPESSYLGTVVKNTAADELRKLHANLESRLQPFWSSVVPDRTVRLRLYTSPNHISTPSNSSASMDNGPVSIQDVVTAPDGSFQARFTVGWTDLANHPGAEHIAFGDPAEEHELLVAAELLPLPSPISSSVKLPSIPPTTLRIPLTYSPVRVISDIDDTIKYSNVTGGARAVFHNVFVKELKDLVIPGMGEWYEEMWKKGVRFHYVSNGPFELLPLIGEFFQISKLPPGSVKLRSYAGKSLFSGLLSAPSARKRAGVLEILDAFPDSRFILIGDSGEQDLELYTELARERADQVLAIFIRDTGEGEPLSDPTGDSFDKMLPPRSAPSSFDAPSNPVSPLPGNFFNSANSHSDSRPPSRSLTPLSMNAPYTARSRKTPVSGGGPKSADYFNTKPLTAEPDPLIDFGDSPTTAQSASSIARSTTSTVATGMTGPVALARMTESEKKGYELQMRVYKARGVLPFRMMLRVFREPGECVETWDVVG